jgi:hypothetical protein
VGLFFAFIFGACHRLRCAARLRATAAILHAKKALHKIQHTNTKNIVWQNPFDLRFFTSGNNLLEWVVNKQKFS